MIAYQSLFFWAVRDIGSTPEFQTFNDAAKAKSLHGPYPDPNYVANYIFFLCRPVYPVYEVTNRNRADQSVVSMCLLAPLKRMTLQSSVDRKLRSPWNEVEVLLFMLSVKNVNLAKKIYITFRQRIISSWDAFHRGLF